MDWNYWTVVALLAVGIIASIYQGEHIPLFNVVDTFNCSNPQSIERIKFTSPCGAVSSPCYPRSTPSVMEGRKGWVVDAGKEGRLVAGYRLTFHDFDIGEKPSALIIGNSAKTNDNGILKVEKDVIVQGIGEIEGGITITEKGKQTHTTNGDHLDINSPTMFITFQLTQPTSNPGSVFSITFCADFDKCSDHEEYCKHGGTCVRDGFKKYRCKCKAGFTGDHCESDSTVCRTGMCDEAATCIKSSTSFVCKCKAGYTGRGLPGECIDVDECATGWHSCPVGANCTNVVGGFHCTGPGGSTVRRRGFDSTSPKEECIVHPTARLRACETSRCAGAPRDKDTSCTEPAKPVSTTQTTTDSEFASYLGMPRVNFAGGMNYDAATVNNKKCVFDNEYFSVSELSTNYIGVVQDTNQFNRFSFGSSNWNPDGSNRISFPNTTITSTCTLDNGCVTTDQIVGAVFKGITSAALIDFDVDWQSVPEVWGLTVHIPGMMKAKYTPAALHIPRSRIASADIIPRGYAIGGMGRFKSKLTDIEWESEYYKIMFNSADTLSIRFLLDLYDQYSHMARITGTIGLTSDLDPLEVTGGRLLQPTNPNLGPAPMYYDKTAEKLYLDVCMSFEGEVDGNFDIPGDVHVGVLETNCVESIENCITPLLNGGPLPLAEGAWYNVFGGVVSVTLVEAEPDVSMSRIVLYAEDKAGKRTIIAMEPEHGIQIGLTTNLAIRLNVGETSTYGAFVTSFGEPVVGATMEIGVIAADSSTDCNRATCFNELSVPLDAISMTIPMSTDTNGRTSVDVTAVKNPGNPRGCGLDGQLYVVRLFYKYLDPIEPTNLKKAVCYFNPSATAGDPKKAECENDGSKIVNIGTLQPIIKVYDEVEVKDKPTWFDVRDIFIQYYNLYPVMWKNGIIDLHSYKDIKKNKAMLEYAMFELNISDPRYMPVTRDLSASRKKLIKNWMDNGMPYSYPGDPTGDTLFSCAAETIPVKITELQRLGQAAIITELTTIPPYVTAWLSLQTEFGRNVEVAGIIKSVFVEEMLHMSLAANLINSVGGVVNLTSMALLPQYPTPLGSGTFFDLMPGVYVSIEPLSLGLARDLFAKIETPATEQEQKIFHSMAEMWKLLSTQTGRDTPTSKNMRLLLNDYQKVRFKRKSPLKKAMNQNLTSDIVWDLIYDFSVRSLKELSNKPTNTIGAFYLRVALFAAMVESCAQKNALANPSANQSPTIFTGDVSKQVDMNQWNNPEDQPDITNPAEPSLNSEGSGSIPISSLYQPLFPVTDLQKAIEAIIEIVYQGEGGSQCTPFVGEKTQDNPTPEISHYYRFLEIANQKKIVKMKVPVEYTAGLTCMNLTGHDCHNDLELGENYCFGGPAIPFREDGVWPLVHNPQNGMYVTNTKAWRLNMEFNNAYTTLLKCLEKGFGGKPDLIKGCYSYMYSLTIIGKKLVSTPIGTKGDTNFVEAPCNDCHASPTWTFMRDITSRAGFPLQG